MPILSTQIDPAEGYEVCCKIHNSTYSLADSGVYR